MAGRGRGGEGSGGEEGRNHPLAKTPLWPEDEGSQESGEQSTVSMEEEQYR